MDDDYSNLKWISAREAGRATLKPPAPPKIDQEISDAVGLQIYVGDPRVTKIITRWKQAKINPDEMDEFLKDGAKVDELRKTLNPERFK